MRKNQIKGIIHDLLRLMDWQNPLEFCKLKNKVEINLLTGEVMGADYDDFSKFYKEKASWFKDRIENLKGDLKDFQKAKIVLIGFKEKIELSYKGEEFSDFVVWGKTLEEKEKLFKKLKKN